ncbi:MAG: hypothetical protein R6T96_07440, partial [Longimicrobiales bacterium]
RKAQEFNRQRLTHPFAADKTIQSRVEFEVLVLEEAVWPNAHPRDMRPIVFGDGAQSRTSGNTPISGRGW